MAPIDGFRLEFHDGTVFRATSNVIISHQTQPAFLLDGLRNFVTLYNTYIDGGGQPGQADSNYSAVFYGFGAGVHTVQIQFQEYKGDTSTWGSSSQNDEPLTKLDELNRVITTTRADSELPALLEVGEYNDPSNHSGISSSDHSPIPVAIGETDLTYTQEEQVSDFDGQITLYDAIDVAQSVDATERRG